MTGSTREPGRELTANRLQIDRPGQGPDGAVKATARYWEVRGRGAARAKTESQGEQGHWLRVEGMLGAT